MGSPPFGRRASHAVMGKEFVYGSQEQFSIGFYDAAGLLKRVIRIPDFDIELLEPEVEAWKDAQVQNAAAEDRVGLRQYLSEVDAPPTKPAYQIFLPDDAGRLWVSMYALELEAPEQWLMFDQTGRWIHTVDMPTGFLPTQIGETWCLGIQTDEMDVQSVSLLAISGGRGGQ